MDSRQFITTTHAKCIIAGEHAVLRGHSALVFPVKSKSLELCYHPARHTLNADYDTTPFGENLLVFLWKPHIYLSSSEHFCSTEKCIQQVEQLRTQNKTLADFLDKDMDASVQLATQAFTMNKHEDFDCLAEAIHKANSCFQHWGLITPALAKHMNILFRGSSGGGYILSLWLKPPTDQNLLQKLRPLF